MANKRRKRSFGVDRKCNVQMWKRMLTKRTELRENADDVPMPSTKIIDINNDCLERVFQFLEFRDLIMVSDANKWLRIAAETVFVRKLKRRMIVIDMDHHSRCTYDIGVYDNAIRIRLPLLAAKTIRLFATNISELYINMISLKKHFFVHVNEYCHQTLKILYICGNHSTLFGALDHPFANVEEFVYAGGIIGPGSEHISRLFPRLRHLDLFECDVVDSKYIFQAFPHLDTFKALCSRLLKQNPFTNSDLRTITTLNPQLQAFSLNGYCDPRIWQTINANLKNLRSIFTYFSSKEAEGSNSLPIHFDRVEEFCVRCDLVPVEGTAIPTDVFSFKCLKKLTVKACRCEDLEGWLDFILVHQTIEELVIDFLVSSLGRILARFELLSEKINKVSQNTKFISVQFGIRTFNGDGINKIPALLETYQWFNKFSVVINRILYLPKCLSKMERFDKIVPQIKSYKMKKHMNYPTFLNYGQIIDFEKCEQ